jgi:polysaccharide export outer membrane protein
LNISATGKLLMKMHLHFICLGILVLASSCAGGTQSEQQMGAGALTNAPSGAQITAGQVPGQVPLPALAQQEAQAQQGKLQEQLMKQTATPTKPDYTDYKVGAEDILQISFLDAEKLSTEARVDGQGEIRLLLVGDVEVGGLSPGEISKKLATLYKEGDYLTNPQIRVAVKEFRHQRVAVTGAVNKPDYYPLIGPRNLLDVLGMAGGLSEKAGEVVYVMRAQSDQAAAPESNREEQSVGAQPTVVDLNRLLLQGAVELNVTVQNGDVVFVPFAKSAYVLGAVVKPGGVLLKENMTVSKAVAQSGGPHLVLASNSVTIVRTDASGQRKTIPVDLGQVTEGGAEDVALKENDIVYVHENGVRRFLYDVRQLFPASIGMPLY